MAIAASASPRRLVRGPSTSSAAHAIHASKSWGTSDRYGSDPIAAMPAASKNKANTGSACSAARMGQALRARAK